MNFTIFDTETTSTDSTFGQMLEFSALFCDRDLDTKIRTLTLQCKLRPHIIPELGALLVTDKTIEEVQSRSMTHFEMAKTIYKMSIDWSPSIWMGWNTIEFDFKWLRQSLYQSLLPPYVHQLNGNKRADALPIARSCHSVDKGNQSLKVPFNKKGKPSFKLEDISKANCINHNKAHTALSDVEATFGVSQVIKRKYPELWQQALATTSKEEAEKIVWANPLFVMTESMFSTTTARVLTAICHHPIYKWTMGIDLKIDPKIYCQMRGHELRNAIRKTPKILRTVQTANHPIILHHDYKNKIKDYKNIDTQTLLERASFLQKQTDLKREIEYILKLEAQEKHEKGYSRIYEAEELIHTESIKPEDYELRELNEFHMSQKWEERYEICKTFKDRTFYQLGRRIIFEESPESLPTETKKDIFEEFRQRFLSEPEAPWNTITKAEISIKEAKGKERNKREKKIIESYSNYIDQLKKTYKTT
jgi:exodeoxyribonuclease-1